MRWPLPGQGRRNRWLVRGLSLLARQRTISISGLHQIEAAHDPFILAINHNNRSEAIFIPTLLMLHRGGRIIHFLADWNYRLIPGVGFIYRRGETITVTRKSARPRILNVLKPLYRSRFSALEQARRQLAAGHSIGIFPEGSINRDPHDLLPGRRGAAYLSLHTQTPVIPVGIRFPHAVPGQPIRDGARMAAFIGAPMHPPQLAARPSLCDTRSWHAAIMNEIGRLSGKTWSAVQEEEHHARR